MSCPKFLFLGIHWRMDTKHESWSSQQSPNRHFRFERCPATSGNVCFSLNYFLDFWDFYFFQFSSKDINFDIYFSIIKCPTPTTVFYLKVCLKARIHFSFIGIDCIFRIILVDFIEIKSYWQRFQLIYFFHSTWIQNIFAKGKSIVLTVHWS